MILRALASLLGWLALASPLAAPPPLHPALWVARANGATLWLFGTVHQLRPGTPWLTGRVAKAFDASDALLLELVAPTPAQTAATLAALAPPRPQPLPEPLRRAVAARSAALGFPPGAFDGQDPWVAATTLGGAALARAGYTPAPAPETLLAREAARAGTPVIGLETQRSQLAAFARLPLPVQRRMLAQALSGDTAATMDRLTAAWGRADVPALHALLERDMAAGGPEVRAALLDRRNAAFAADIAGRARLGDTLFVAIGAGHLLGTGGVPARLAAAGWSVRRVQ
ncbi:TraB/GumN family protein [Sphingomonas sp. VNH70]|uniref:TraB/GumN family protein n=1 Tax=Sphingomonas silueang TaxID=3156617 RepID=UPI0032B611C7